MNETEKKVYHSNDLSIARTSEEKALVARFCQVIEGQKQVDISRIVGTSGSYIGNIRNKGYMPGAKVLLRVIKRYNVNPVWLFLGIGTMYGTAAGKNVFQSELQQISTQLRRVADEVDVLQSSSEKEETPEEKTKREFEEFKAWQAYNLKK